MVCGNMSNNLIVKSNYRLKSAVAQIVKTKMVHGIPAYLYGFPIDRPFIPLGTVRIPNTQYNGMLNMKPLYERSLMKVFEEYEALRVMLTNILFVDIQDFELQPGEYLPEGNYTTKKEDDRYVLYYLEKLK